MFEVYGQYLKVETPAKTLSKNELMRIMNISSQFEKLTEILRRKLLYQKHDTLQQMLKVSIQPLLEDSE